MWVTESVSGQVELRRAPGCPTIIEVSDCAYVTQSGELRYRRGGKPSGYNDNTLARVINVELDETALHVG